MSHLITGEETAILEVQNGSDEAKVEQSLDG